MNGRVTLAWECYKKLFECRGYRLDTARDAKQYYERVFTRSILDSPTNVCHKEAYTRACKSDPDALCRDAGLVSHPILGRT